MRTALLPPSASNFREASRLLIVADLARLPTSLPSGDIRYELDDGRLIVSAPPGFGHGRRQALIVSFLQSDVEARGLGEVYAGVAIILLRNPDRVVGADGVQAFHLEDTEITQRITERRS
jgi:Uma2 family endonuclease